MMMLVPDESEATPLDHSDEYYYNQLSEREQGLYRQIYGAALNFTESFETGYGNGSLKGLGVDVLSAVRYDHPELIQLSNRIEYYDSGTMFLQYSCTKAELASYWETIDAFCTGLSFSTTTRFDTVTLLNQIIGDQAYYDDEAVGKTGVDYAHNMKGIFVDGKAVCEGYALAFKYLCDLYGVPCICVVGDAVQGSDRGAHMWNYVKMGSKWYAMDVTWNDSSDPSAPVDTDYSLIGSQTVVNGDKFSDTHVLNDSLSELVTLPEIEATAYTVTVGTDDYFDYPFNSTYYYDKLTANGKKAYKAIVQGAKEFQTEIATGVTGETYAIFDAVRAIRFDRQDLFQIPNSYTVHSDGRVVWTYDIEEEQYEEMCQKIAVALVPLEGKLSKCTYPYDKVLTIHDYLVSNIAYTKTDNAHDIYGALVNGKCVCEGYARAFQYVCTLYGVNVICVSGDATNSSGTEAHMWNLVQMNDGKWYNMDVTWDDPLVNGSDSGKVHYDYFLVGSDTKNDRGAMFKDSHVPDMAPNDGKTIVFDNSILPEASAVDYYIRPGSDQEFIIEGEPVMVNGSYVVTLEYAVLNDNFNYMQGHGALMLEFGKGLGKMSMTVANFALLLDYMEEQGMAEISFVYDVKTEKVSVGPISLDNDVYRFALRNGDADISMKDIGKSFEMTLYMPFDASGAEFLEFLIFAWDIDSATMPIFSSVYKDGYVAVTVSSADTGYFAGSTPIKGVPVLYVIAGIAVLLLLVFLLLGHHSKKKARKAAERRR